MTTKKNETAVEKTTAEKKTRKTATRKTTARKTTTTRRKTTKKAEEEETPAATPITEVSTSVTKPESLTDAKNEPLAEAKPEPMTVVKPEQKEEAKLEAKAEVKTEPKAEVKTEPKVETKPEPKPIPPLPQVRIESIVDLINAPHRQLLLSDQQIQQLTLAEAEQRFRFMEGTLAWILNYDVVISDTNIWIELLVGHTSSHSDPKVNARLLFERQLDFISKLVRFRGARFLMMSETYEEIDRFATMQAPTNYKEADFSDESVCRNIAARLAKRLILSQQRENRLRIEGITSESHHAAFADPAIIRRTVELFAEGKRVLLLTNDTSVGIRSIGMCDDLQRTNNIDDETWERVYTPLRPMVFTFDDLKLLDNYTRQYHFLQMAAGKQWMEDVPQCMEKHNVEPLRLWMEGFRAGDKYPESRNAEQQKKQQKPQQKQDVVTPVKSEQVQQKHNQKQEQSLQKQNQKQEKTQQRQNKQQKQKPQVETMDANLQEPKIEVKPQAEKIETKQNVEVPQEVPVQSPQSEENSSVEVISSEQKEVIKSPKRRSYRRPQRAKKSSEKPTENVSIR